MKSIIKILVLLAAFQLLSPPASAEDIVIGSKNFEENRLLCEMFARLIENYTDLTVERKFNLAGSDVCFEAVKSGEIDIYPEYTGTGLISLMNAEEAGSARETMFRVRTA
ncbi:MAG TPA: glycine betaine ABC transporter substrate-binding protein, partial [bacterium]